MANRIPHQLTEGTFFAILIAWVIISSIASSPSSAFRNMQNRTGRCFISSATFCRSSGRSVLRSMATPTLSKSANPHFNARQNPPKITLFQRQFSNFSDGFLEALLRHDGFGQPDVRESLGNR